MHCDVESMSFVWKTGGERESVECYCSENLVPILKTITAATTDQGEKTQIHQKPIKCCRCC